MNSCIERKMKDTGIEWLGEIPSDWEISRLKFLADINTGTRDTVDKVENGVYPFFVRSKKIEKINSYSYDGEAILTAGDGDIGKIFHYINGAFDYHQRVYMMSKFKQKIGKFLFYYIAENFKKDIEKYNAKTTVESLRLPWLLNFPVAVPPKAKQQKIVHYLDKKCSQMDGTIDKEKQSIEKLKEYKQSLITEAVTKGLDKNVELKPSGADWIGDIPKHWEVMRFKYASSLSSKKINAKDSLLKYIGLENIESSTGKLVNMTTEYQSEGIANLFNAGQLLFGKLRPYLAKVFITHDDGCCSSEFLVLEPEFVKKNYLFYYLLSDRFIDIVNSSTYGSKMPRASWDFIQNLSQLIPPIHEQDQIAKFLDKKCTEIDRTINKKETLIEKLIEYKKSLIYGCVTGKKEVI